jgi:pentapeptide MXKDX repeat protein
MRNTKTIVAILAGCMALSGAAFAQDASQSSPTPASTAGTPTHTSNDSMKKTGDSMSHGTMGNDSMKSTHKKHKTKKDGSMSEPAKSSTSGM